MKLKLELTAKDWSRNMVLFYGVAQALLRDPHTLVRVELTGKEVALNRIRQELELAGLYPELDLDEQGHVLDDDIP